MLYILGAVLIWAFFNGVLVKSIKTSGVGVGFWTAVMGVIFYLGDKFKISDLYGLNESQLLALACLGVFAGLNNACYYTALKISIPNAALFHYMAPLLIVVWILLIPAFNAPVPFIAFVALIIGFFGTAYVAAPSLKEGNWKLILLGSGSAIFYSLEIILAGYLSQKLNIAPEISSFTKLLFQAIVMLAVSVTAKESIGIRSGSDMLKIALGGVLLYLSFVLYFTGSADPGVSDLDRGILSYIDRIGAIALGAWIFKEKITRNIWIGGALILGASLLIII